MERTPFTVASMKQAAYLNGACRIDPARHEVLADGGFIRSMKDLARLNSQRIWDKLFLYHHKIKKSFVLAYRVPEYPEMNLMMELYVFPEHPDHIGKTIPPPKEELLSLFEPKLVAMRKMLTRMKEADKEGAVEQERQHYLTDEYAKKLTMNGFENEGNAVDRREAIVRFPKEAC